MRISDWSSDVCSSDLAIEGSAVSAQAIAAGQELTITATGGDIATGNASAAGQATLTASGGIATGDLTLGNFGDITAGGAVALGDVETALRPRPEGPSIPVRRLAPTAALPPPVPPNPDTPAPPPPAPPPPP